jgi:ribose transport system substrate-binding protein
MSTRLIGGVVGLILAVALTACGSSTSTSGGGSGSASGDGVKCGMVGLYNGPYPNAMATGAKMATDAVGADFTQLGPAGLDPNKAIADFQNGVASGMKGMLVMAYPGDLWTAPINRAAGQGVTVATADDYAENSKAITEVGPPKVTMGAALADEYLKQIPEDASGVIVPGLCVAGLPVLEAPLNGFRIRIEEKRPGIKVLDPEVTAGDPAGDFAAWQRIAAKYPEAIGFVGACDVDLPNLIKLKESTPGATYLIGSTAGGDDPVAVQAVKGGTMVGVVTQRPWVQGYVGMKLITDNVLNGTAMPDGWINTGFEIVTKDNVDDIVKVLQDPVEAQKHFGAMADEMVKNAATIAHKPMTYEYDVSSINEPNPQP